MTTQERKADLRNLITLEEKVSLHPESQVKLAVLRIIGAARILLAEPPNIDKALNTIGMAAGNCMNHLEKEPNASTESRN